ncbi:hypothetical protein ACWDAZ_39065, partial [Streptomyces sp. NPDC001215]
MNRGTTTTTIADQDTLVPWRRAVAEVLVPMSVVPRLHPGPGPGRVLAALLLGEPSARVQAQQVVPAETVTFRAQQPGLDELLQDVLGVGHLSSVGPKNVRVSAIEPGIVGTELQEHVTDSGALEW